MSAHLCIRTRQWPSHLIRIIIVVIVTASAARLDPAAVLPVIIGVALGGWLMARVPVPALAAR